MKYLLIFIILLTQNSLASAACYRIFDSTGQVVYQSSTPPVDLSGSISQAVESKFPGGHLIIDQQLCGSSSVVVEPTGSGAAHGQNPLIFKRAESAEPTGFPLGAPILQEPSKNHNELANQIPRNPSEKTVASKNEEVLQKLVDQTPAYQEGGLVNYGSSSSYNSDSSYSGGYSRYRGSRSGRSVHVRSYTRSNGTHVRSHYRSAPRIRR